MVISLLVCSYVHIIFFTIFVGLKKHDTKTYLLSIIAREFVH